MSTEIDIDTVLRYYNMEIAKLTQRALVAEAAQEKLSADVAELKAESEAADDNDGQ